MTHPSGPQSDWTDPQAGRVPQGEFPAQQFNAPRQPPFPPPPAQWPQPAGQSPLRPKSPIGPFIAIPLVGLLLVVVGFLFHVPLGLTLGILVFLIGIVVLIVVAIVRASSGPGTPPSTPAGPWAGPTAYDQYGRPLAPWSAQQTNGFAIAALVTSLVLAPLGIIFGHLALSQIRRTGEAGRGLAIAGLVIGYVWTALALIWLICLFAMLR